MAKAKFLTKRIGTCLMVCRRKPLKAPAFQVELWPIRPCRDAAREHVESVHRGAVAVCDAAGRALLEIGDVAQPVFPRSAVKAIQALPLVESGAADALRFGDRELALACASHRGEAAHVELARSMLVGAGLDENALECGSHWPGNHDATIALARSGGTPTALHNNCSGKHSGFLCTCTHIGLEHQGYVAFEHPFQATIREVMENVTEAPHGAGNSAVDGCSIPTYAIRSAISRLALRRWRQAALPPTGRGQRNGCSACMAEPFFASGSHRRTCR